jgi:RND family efflux transporter MFP subunit
LLIPVLLLAGCHSNPLEQPATAQAPPAPAAGALPRVTVGPVQKETLRRFTTQPARVLAFEETPLYSRLAAYVDSVPVDIGDEVQPGDPLVKLFTPELRDDVARQTALVAQATAEVAQAEAAVKAATAALDTAKAKARQAESAVARTTADRERWQSQLARYRQLAKDGSVTTKLVEETEAQFRAAEAAEGEVAAQVDSAKAAVAEAQAKLGSAAADVGAAKAKLGVAEAAERQAQTMLAYGEIKAPFAGVVTQRHVDPRHFVQPSHTKPLVVVANSKKLRIVADIPELEAPLADKGDAATIQAQALGPEEFPATLARTSWALDPANRSLRVEVDLDGDGRLRPGMYATLKVLLAERKDVPTVPFAAVVWQGRETFCCRVEAGKVRRVPIKLGLRVGDRVEVATGLTAGQEIVLARADALTDGQAVEPVRAEK